MQISLNFESAVCIGSFNPAILTPNFLQKSCSFSSEREPLGKTTPVISELRYGDIQFIVELDKFQIIRRNPQNFAHRDLIKVMINYLSILEFTPISLIGINFNYTLHKVDLDRIRDIFNSVHNIEQFIKNNILNTSIEWFRNEEDKINLRTANFSYNFDEIIKNAIRVNFENNHIIVNNNYEICELTPERSRINYIMEKYDILLQNNDVLIDMLGAG